MFYHYLCRYIKYIYVYTLWRSSCATFQNRCLNKFPSSSLVTMHRRRRCRRRRKLQTISIDTYIRIHTQRVYIIVILFFTRKVLNFWSIVYIQFRIWRWHDRLGIYLRLLRKVLYAWWRKVYFVKQQKKKKKKIKFLLLYIIFSLFSRIYILRFFIYHS